MQSAYVLRIVGVHKLVASVEGKGVGIAIFTQVEIQGKNFGILKGVRLAYVAKHKGGFFIGMQMFLQKPQIVVTVVVGWFTLGRKTGVISFFH